MLDYVKSEVFRAFKSSYLRIFLGLTAAFVVIFIAIAEKFLGVDYDMLEMLGQLAPLGAMILYSICLVMAFKTKDTKVQILSYGISRTKMFFWDLISYQIIAIICTVIMAVMAIVGTKAGEIFGLIGAVGGYGEFIVNTGWLIFYGINLINGLFGLAYITNNASLGIIGNFILIPIFFELLGLFVSAKEKILEKVYYFSTLQPYMVFQGFTNNPLNGGKWETVIYAFVYCLMVFVAIGLVKFRKQEIY